MNFDDFFKALPHAIVDDQITLGDLAGYKLAAPRSFWNSPNEIKEEITNGCGPGGWGDALVPDTVYGLSIEPACKIHDWMFTVFNCEAGFKLSNQLFLDNMSRINQEKTKNCLLRWLRSRRIKKYFIAVRDFGRLFFYDTHAGFYKSDELYQ